MNEQLEEFLKLHGAAWSKILQSPSFNAGMIFLSIRLMEGIKNLTDHELTSNATVILSDIRGRLRHESELIALPVPPEESVNGELREEYVNQVEESFLEQQRTAEPPKPKKKRK